MYKLEKVILWLSIESLFSSNYRLRTRYKNNETLVLDSFCSEAKKIYNEKRYRMELYLWKQSVMFGRMTTLNDRLALETTRKKINK